MTLVKTLQAHAELQLLGMRREDSIHCKVMYACSNYDDHSAVGRLRRCFVALILSASLTY